MKTNNAGGYMVIYRQNISCMLNNDKMYGREFMSIMYDDTFIATERDTNF